ncbi:hypothetical protein AS156_18130 [Bradyrhizobium macuxiense]|uniref:Uncharacterized protein n=1 Tax=Bradyrhizobium macuxiense TaxID=1755647 RepID=A0A109JGC5_9BRAD|nr:hypothetical protein [Bradyrhizobium macuxiense]KWV48401.1 hypothetical protein AS156_18130 [Bradyrhizobium macuxiense]
MGNDGDDDNSNPMSRLRLARTKEINCQCGRGPVPRTTTPWPPVLHYWWTGPAEAFDNGRKTNVISFGRTTTSTIRNGCGRSPATPRR